MTTIRPFIRNPDTNPLSRRLTQSLPFSFLSRRQILALTLGLGLGLLAACTSAQIAGEPLSPEEATVVYTELIEGHKLDLSLVRAARLSLDGKRLEVTSLMPAKVASVSDEAEAARSLVAFSPDKDSVVFYTRARNGGSAHYLELDWQDMKAGDRFVFPFLTKSGDLVDTRVEVIRLIQK